MSALFLKIVNMSISASWLVLAVLLLRLLLKKAPKWASVILWGIVALRLICPFSFEGVFSLIPSAETVSSDIMMDATPELQTGIGVLDGAINPVISGSFAPAPLASANPLQILVPVWGILWLFGIFVMLLYTAVSYLLLRRKVSTAVLLKENIYQSENVISPFVLGIIKPKIYLPFQIDGGDMAYVIAHEQAHIRRKDHWWKPFGFLLLTVYWFNPILWLGYVLLCRDIELACDERVIRKLDSEGRADYTQALVSCSVNRRSIAACPLAFGEVGVKQRVKSVMNYKKPAFWIILAAVVICAVVAVCFLTDPVKDGEGTINYDAETPVVVNPWVQEYVPGTDGIIGNVDVEKYQSISADFEIGADKQGMAVFKDPHKAFLKLVTLYPDAIAAIQQEFGLEPLAENDYALYKTYGWQVTSDSTRIREQATFVTGFFDIYENSFIEDVPDHTAEIVNTITTSLKTYYELDDGTWRADGRNYRYRLELTGQMPNAKGDCTFVYLSNLPNITFEQAWKAAGLSSNMEDYFSAEEAVLVDWVQAPIAYTGAAGSGELAYGVLLDANGKELAVIESIDHAISKAILDTNAGDRFLNEPTGQISVESHILLDTVSVSGTPVEGKAEHTEEIRAYVQYVYHRYTYSKGKPVSVAAIATPAEITFSANPKGGYSLKGFWEPDHGDTYGSQIRERFPEAVAEALLDPGRDNLLINDLESKCLTKAERYIAEMSGEKNLPVAWIFDPSNETAKAFRIEFDIPNTNITVKCENGLLISSEITENKALAELLDTEEYGALFWSPSASDGYTGESLLTFSLEYFEKPLYEGTVTITGRALPDGCYAYVATIACDGLVLETNPENIGFIIRKAS